MKKLFTPLAAAAILAAALSPSAGRAAAIDSSHAMSLRLLSPSHPITISSGRAVAFAVQVGGVRLDAHKLGKKSVAGHGHIQVYLDKIPSGAYRRVTFVNLVLAVGTTNFTFEASKTWVRTHRGHHRLIFALARNDDMLYHARTATLGATIK